MLKRTLYLLLFPILLSACSDINCPLNSTVFSSYTMKGDTLKDTLSIIAIRPDSSDAVLLNRFVGKTTFKIQMSYVKDVDSLLFLYSDTLAIVNLIRLLFAKQISRISRALIARPTISIPSLARTILDIESTPSSSTILT